MKKLLFLILLTTAAAVAAFAQTGPGTKPGTHLSTAQKNDGKQAAAPVLDKKDTTQQKLYTIQGSLEGYQVLIHALDLSTDSHVSIEALKQWIITQINAQVSDKPKQ